MEKARWSELVRYNNTIVDYLKKTKAQIVGGHEVHVEEKLVTQTCDCSRVDYLKDSLAQIACGREGMHKSVVKEWIIKKVCVTAQLLLFAWNLLSPAIRD